MPTRPLSPKTSSGVRWIRQGKCGKDRMVPLAEAMVDDLRR